MHDYDCEILYYVIHLKLKYAYWNNNKVNCMAWYTLFMHGNNITTVQYIVEEITNTCHHVVIFLHQGPGMNKLNLNNNGRGHHSSQFYSN